MRVTRRLLPALLAVCLGASARAETAADFPNRPITLIIPFAAGVSADLLFRGIADVASKQLGQPIIIDNRSGASGTLGPAVLATMKGDGYTIGQVAVPIFRIPHMQKVTFDPLKDFTYIINLASYQLGAVVNSDSQFKTWADVIAYAKANPGKFTYSTIGAATTPGIAAALAAREAGVEMTHVPSKGGGESIAALLGGHVNMIVESPAWARLVAAGQLRLKMVLGSQRRRPGRTYPR